MHVLFIVASNTFTTQETMTNAMTARNWCFSSAKSESLITHSFVAISANEAEVKRFGNNPENQWRR